MKRGRSAVTSSKVSYAIRYTASTLSVFMKLSALAFVGIAAPAHGAGETVLLQDGAIVFGGILRPTVGMMHATPWRIAGADGGLECSNSEPCIDRAADGVTYDPTGPSIEDRSQVHKAGRDCDIGDVGYPQLVRAIQFHVLREIGEDRIIVIAIRRRDKTPPLLWIQRMLAHEPADFLGVHDNATMA